MPCFLPCTLYFTPRVFLSTVTYKRLSEKTEWHWQGINYTVGIFLFLLHAILYAWLHSWVGFLFFFSSFFWLLWASARSIVCRCIEAGGFVYTQVYTTDRTMTQHHFVSLKHFTSYRMPHPPSGSIGVFVSEGRPSEFLVCSGLLLWIRRHFGSAVSVFSNKHFVHYLNKAEYSPAPRLNYLI